MLLCVVPWIAYGVQFRETLFRYVSPVVLLKQPTRRPPEESARRFRSGRKSLSLWYR